ncbi:MAG: amidohydrolase family protein [Planctomycetota bacterium]
MSNITYLDACCYLGRSVRMADGTPETPEAILAEMDHFGIHEALMVDYLSRESSPMAGNLRIIERTKNHPRLHPAWVGLMTHSRELPPPKDLVAQMRELAVGALFLFYGQYDIRLSDWGVDDLLEVLAESRVPLFLCPSDWRDPGKVNATDWEGVVGVCRRFPDLPVVVTENRIYKSQRAVYAAMAECPNLKLDVSALWLHKRVEFICREFGADRFVWGSQLPERNAGVPIMQINYSDISEGELALIAGGNIRQMLSWNENIEFVGETVNLPEPDDPLHRAVRERLSLRGEEFYDCHGHIGRSTPHHVVEDAPADLVREMDKFGIRACCVFSIEGVFADETFGNDLTAEAVRQFPDRFVGFTLLNPNHGERLMREEMERGLAMGMKGIKLICSYHGYPTEGPLVDIACAFAHEHGQFILNHHWGSAEQIERLCTAYPNACFFTGHSTAAYTAVTKKVDNLFICTCPFLNWRQTEQYVKLYGADRILFGSDLTDLPIAWGMAQVLYARISESDKRKIMGENLKALMERYSR